MIYFPKEVTDNIAGYINKDYFFSGSVCKRWRDLIPQKITGVSNVMKSPQRLKVYLDFHSIVSPSIKINIPYLFKFSPSIGMVNTLLQFKNHGYTDTSYYHGVFDGCAGYPSVTSQSKYQTALFEGAAEFSDNVEHLEFLFKNQCFPTDKACLRSIANGNIKTMRYILEKKLYATEHPYKIRHDHDMSWFYDQIKKIDYRAKFPFRYELYISLVPGSYVDKRLGGLNESDIIKELSRYNMKLSWEFNERLSSCENGVECDDIEYSQFPSTFPCFRMCKSYTHSEACYTDLGQKFRCYIEDLSIHEDMEAYEEELERIGGYVI